MNARITVEMTYTPTSDVISMTGYVWDQGEVIHRTETISFDLEDWTKVESAMECLAKLCRAWVGRKAS